MLNVADDLFMNDYITFIEKLVYFFIFKYFPVATKLVWWFYTAKAAWYRLTNISIKLLLIITNLIMNFILE